MTMVECWMCGQEFEPGPESLKAWSDSDRDFEPTDWECGQCNPNQSVTKCLNCGVTRLVSEDLVIEECPGCHDDEIDLTMVDMYDIP